MASLLRRVSRKHEQVRSASASASDESENDESGDLMTSSFSGFAALALLDEQDERSQSEHEGESASDTEAVLGEEEEQEEVEVDELIVGPVVPKRAQRKKARQRARKQQQKVKQQQKTADSSEQMDPPRDEIDAALAELGLEPTQGASANCMSGMTASAGNLSLHSESGFGSKRDPLAVSVSRLDPEAELVRVFGRGTVRQVQQEREREEMEDMARRMGAAAHTRQGRAVVAQIKSERKRRQQRQTRESAVSGGRSGRVQLIERRDTWPSHTANQPNPSAASSSAAAANSHDYPPPGFGLVAIGAGKQANSFRFAWSDGYRACQKMFFACERTHNPATLQGLLHQHNFWHVDALLRLSDVSRLAGDNDGAVDFLHRALFSLQLAWQRSGCADLDDLNARTASVPFSIPEEIIRGPERDANKALFTALLHYAMQLSREGCSRTALEFAKLLLLLDWPNDPVGVLLVADVFALKARDVGWLLTLCFGDEGMAHFLPNCSDLLMLPNFAFSAALAAWMSETDAADASQYSPGRKIPAADVLLQEALSKFPEVLVELCENQDMASAVGGLRDGMPVSQHPIFATRLRTDDAKLLQQLAQLYASRSAALWKTSDVASWLRRNAVSVLEDAEISERRSSLRAEAVSAFSSEEFKGRNLLKQVRESVYTHLCLTETAENVVAGALPADIIAELRQGAGAVAVYEDWMEHHEEYEPQLPRGAGGNALGLFLNSLINPHHTVNAEGEAVTSNWMDSLVDLMRHAVDRESQNATGNGE